MARRDFLLMLGSLLAGLFGRLTQVKPEPASPVALAAEAKAIRARLLTALPYERIEATGEHAFAEWERLRAAGRGWPVIVGDDEQLEAIAEQFVIDDPSIFPPAAPPGYTPPALRSAETILQAADKIKLPEDLRKWLGEDGEAIRADIGEWPAVGVGQGAGLTVASDILTSKPFPRVHILLIPTDDGADVPAYLRWGGWNACPPPEMHVAALRQWNTRYGAELVGINRDTMNVRVSGRPQTREEALGLATDQYLYCADIVDQGVETLAALGSILMNEDWWFFWWD